LKNDFLSLQSHFAGKYFSKVSLNPVLLTKDFISQGSLSHKL